MPIEYRRFSAELQVHRRNLPADAPLEPVGRQELPAMARHLTLVSDSAPAAALTAVKPSTDSGGFGRRGSGVQGGSRRLQLFCLLVGCALAASGTVVGLSGVVGQKGTSSLQVAGCAVAIVGFALVSIARAPRRIVRPSAPIRTSASATPRTTAPARPAAAPPPETPRSTRWPRPDWSAGRREAPAPRPAATPAPSPRSAALPAAPYAAPARQPATPPASARYAAPAGAPRPLRAIDRALQAWIAERGTDGLVVVAGDEAGETARTAWAALQAARPGATVLVIEPPEACDVAVGGYAIDRLLAQPQGCDLRDAVVWIDRGDEHIERGLDAPAIELVRSRLPNAVIVLVLRWSSLVATTERDPAFGSVLWAATDNLWVRAER
jgi:hypothetical protein